VEKAKKWREIMEMSWVWTGLVTLSLVFGLLSGSLDAVANAALEGARSAIELSLAMAGVLCLWSGVMEIMKACGLSAGLARLFRPVLRRLLPEASRDPETLAAVSANVSANLLGLGNAATPLGIAAVRRMRAAVSRLTSPAPLRALLTVATEQPQAWATIRMVVMGRSSFRTFRPMRGAFP